MVESPLQKTLNDPDQPVLKITWSPTGEWLAVGSQDSNIYIYDRNLSLTATLSQPNGAVRELSWSPDENLLGAVEQRGQGRLLLYSTEDWSVVKTFSEKFSRFERNCGISGGCGVQFLSGDFTLDGNGFWIGSRMRFLLTPSRWKEFLIQYDLSSPNPDDWRRVQVNQVGKNRYEGRLPTLKISSKGHLAYINDANQVKIKGETTLNETSRPRTLKFSSNGTWLAIPDSDRLIIYNTEPVEVNGTTFSSWTPIHEISPTNDGVKTVAWGPRDSFLAIGTRVSPFEFEIWSSPLNREAENWERLVSEVRGHEDTINDIDWSLDGTTLVTGSSDSTVKVWNTEFTSPPCTVNQVLGENFGITAPEPVGSIGCLTGTGIALLGLGGLGAVLTTRD